MDTIEVVRVRFHWPAKIHEFSNPNQLKLKRGQMVLVRRDGGGSMVGSVAIEARLRAKRDDDHELLPILREATEQDIRLETMSHAFHNEVKAFFETRLRAREISGVRLVDCEKIDGGQRLVIYVHSENKRFDPREIAIELGHKFQMRIDMRNVGVRDAARLAGGIGKCGLSLCCSTWLPDFGQVNIRMAKDQGLSLEPESISGMCGRLLCCLGYEHQNYVEMGMSLPKVGKVVITPKGEGRVVKLDILRGKVTVRSEVGEYETFEAADVKRKFGPGGGGRQQAEDDKDADSDADASDDNAL